MNQYNLYSSAGCHLCEQALDICLAVLSHAQVTVVDIIDQERVSHESKTLVELYGVHIPVLEQLHQQSENNQKLFWPFTLSDVIKLNEKS